MSIARINIYFRDAPVKQPERENYMIEMLWPLFDELQKMGYSIPWDTDKKRYIAKKVEGERWQHPTVRLHNLGQ